MHTHVHLYFISFGFFIIWLFRDWSVHPYFYRPLRTSLFSWFMAIQMATCHLCFGLLLEPLHKDNVCEGAKSPCLFVLFLIMWAFFGSQTVSSWLFSLSMIDSSTLCASSSCFSRCRLHSHLSLYSCACWTYDLSVIDDCVIRETFREGLQRLFVQLVLLVWRKRSKRLSFTFALGRQVRGYFFVPRFSLALWVYDWPLCSLP